MQTTFPRSMSRALAGMVADSCKAEYWSRVLATKQLVQLTFGTTDGTYTVDINDDEVANFVASSNTAAQIRDGILADLVASSAPLAATALSTNKILLESLGFESTDEFEYALSTVTGYSASELVEQGQQVAFGLGVVVDTRAPAPGGQRCMLPRLTTDISAGFLGIACMDTSMEPNASGWANQSVMTILRSGHIWVKVEKAVAEFAPLYCRFASGSGGSTLGIFRDDADTSTAAAVTGLRAIESCSGAGIVKAEFLP
jgi:hypothetical protein